MKIETSIWRPSTIIGIAALLAGVVFVARSHAAPTTIIEKMKATAARRASEEVTRRKSIDELVFAPPRSPRGFPICSAPPAPVAPLDPNRSLFVHDTATLTGADFSLKRTVDQLATQAAAAGVTGIDGAAIFRELWDTQNAAPGLGLGAHCNDNGGTVNGFPVSCRTTEGGEASGTTTAKIASYQPVGLVNRLDLAGDGWRNCGEHRIVYGKAGGPGRNFIIFEAVLPNPRPGCREACLPVARFWRELSDPSMDKPADRAKALAEFYYNGLPGFRPVVHVDHYNATGVSSVYGGSGSGQIRTNSFMSSPWLLKEFKTAINCSGGTCAFEMVPTMVKVNPFGDLWNEDIASNPANPLNAQAGAFETDVLASVTGLSAPSLLGFGYPVNLKADAAESESQTSSGVSNYLQRFGAAAGPTNTFRSMLTSLAAAQGLSANQVVARAGTQSCAGCHSPGIFGLAAPGSIGTVSRPDATTTDRWPDSLGFVHVGEQAQPLAELTGLTFGTSAGQNQGFPLSPALRGDFLVARGQFLDQQLTAPNCPCRRRFPSQLDPRALAKLRAIELKKGPPPVTASQMARLPPATLAARRKEATRARQAEIAAQAKATGTTPEALPSEKAQPLNIDLTPAGSDAVKRSALLRSQVQSLLAKELPRRTVTGSFTSE